MVLISRHICLSILWFAVFCGVAVRVVEAQTLPPPAQLRLLEGHTKPIYSVAHSPDGKFLYTASFDRTVKIWSRETGKVLRTYADHQNGVLALAVAKNGMQFATAGLDRNVHLYDVPIRDPLSNNGSLGGDPTAVAVSGDGSLIATGDSGPLLRLWNGLTVQHLRDFPGLTAPVTGAVFSADKKRITASTADGWIRSWDVDKATLIGSLNATSAVSFDVSADGNVVATMGQDGVIRLHRWPTTIPTTIPGHSQALTGIRISPDGKRAITSSVDQTVRLFDLSAAPKELKSFAGQPGPVSSLAVSHAFDTVVSGSTTGVLKFWKSDGVDLKSLAGHTGAISALTFHPSGKQIGSGGQDGTIRFWQLPPPEPIALSGHSQPVNSFAINSTGEVVLTASADKQVLVFNTANGKLTKKLVAAPQPLTSVSLSSDDQSVVAGDATGSLRTWQLQDGKTQSEVYAHAGGVTSVVMIPKTQVAVTSGGDGVLKTWQLPLPGLRPLPPHGNAVTALTVAKKNPWVVTSAADLTTRLSSLETAKEIRLFPGATAPATSLAFDPAESVLTATLSNGYIKGWTVADSKPAFELLAHAGINHKMAFHPKGTQFATVGQDGVVRLWDYPLRASNALVGHTKPLLTAAVNKDGSLLATGGADQVVRLWQPDGKAIATLEGHAQPVSVLDFHASPNILSGDHAGKVRVWKAAAGAAIREISAHNGAVTGISAHPSQPLFATSGADGLVKVWQLPVNPATVLPSLPQPVSGIALTADGKQLLSGSTDGTLQVINTDNGQPRELKGQVGALQTAVLSPDNATVAAGSADGSIRLWKLADGSDLGSINGSESPLQAIAWHPAGQLLASAGQDGLIRLWQMPIIAPRLWEGQKQPISVVSLSPNGQILATASPDKSILLWNMANGQQMRSLEGHTAGVTTLAWKADSSVLVSGSIDKTARLWTVGDGKQVGLLDQHMAEIRAVAMSANGDQVFTGGTDHIIKQWTVADSKLVKEFKGHGGVLSQLIVSADAANLFSSAADGTCRQWAVAAGTETRSINHGAAVTSLAISADSTKIATGGADNLIKLWNISDGAAVGTLTGHKGAVQGLKWTSDNLRVTSASADGTLRLWDIKGPLLQTYTSSKGAFSGVEVSPDQKVLIVGGADQKIHLVGINAVRAFAGHTGAVNSLAFNPAGDRLISGGIDKTVRAWNPVDGSSPTQYAGSTDAVNVVTISRDGSKVLASGADKVVRSWNLPDGAAGPAWPQPAVVRSLALNSDLTRIAVAGDDGIIRLIDFVTGKELEAFTGHVGSVGQVVMSADGKTIYSGGADKSLRQWPISILQMIPAHDGKSNAVAFNGDGSVLLSGGDDRLVKMWQINGQAVRQFAGAAAAITGLKVRSDSGQVAAVVADNSVMLWNFDGNPFAAMPKLPQPAAVTSLSYSPDNLKLAIGVGDAHVRVYQSGDGKLLQDIVRKVVPNSVVYTRDSKSVVVASADNSAEIIPVSVQKLINGHEGAVTAVAYHPAIEQLLTGGADKTVRVWNLADSSPVRSYAGPTDMVTQVGMSSDGTRVYAASQDKTLRVWNFSDAAVLATLTHPAPVRSFDVTSDGNRVATSTDDASGRIWDIGSGKELQVFQGHTAAIPAIGLSPDGKTIVTGSHDKTVRASFVSASTVIAAHPTRATVVMALPDGKQLLSSGDDKILKLWDLQGKLVRQFAGSQTPLRRVCVRSDLKQLAAAGDEQLTDKGLYLWNFETAALTQRIETPASITGISYSPDGQQVAMCHTDNHLRIYATEGGLLLEDITLTQPPLMVGYLSAEAILVGHADNQTRLYRTSIQKVLSGHQGPVTALSFSKSGQFVLSSGIDKIIQLWDVPTGKVVRSFTGCTDAISSTSLSPDDKYVIASCNDKLVRIWPVGDTIDPKAPPVVVAPAMTVTHANPVHCAVFSPDGQRFATCGDDLLIHLWDRLTGLELERFVGHTAAPTKLAFSSDGFTLYSAANDATARHWPVTSLQAKLAHKGAKSLVKVLADGKTVVTAGEDQHVVSWSTADLAEVRRFAGAAGPIRSLAVSPDGLSVMAGGDDKHVRIWKAEDGSALLAEPLSAAVTSLTWGASGKKIVVGCADNSIASFGLRSVNGKFTAEKLQESVGHTGAIQGLGLSSDERNLFSVSADRTWKRWLSSGIEPTLRLEGHTSQIYSLEFSPDGKFLASASGDKSAIIWNVADGKKLAQCVGHGGQVYAVAFSPNGQVLASAGADKIIRLWKTDGTLIKEVKDSLKDGVYSLQFYADSNYLLSAGLDRTWQFWNTAEGKNQRTATGHTDHIYRAIFNPAWNRVASVDYSGHLFIWDSGSGNPLHHQQLPVAAAYSISYSPDGKELVIGTQDSRLVVLQVPAAAH